jgi:hypothetical protein
MLEEEFNAGMLVSRTAKELRSKYDCLKKAAKKESARQVQSLRGTGGGPPHKPARNVAVLERVLNLVPLGAVGMAAVVDSDAVDGDTNQSARASSRRFITNYMHLISTIKYHALCKIQSLTIMFAFLYFS